MLIFVLSLLLMPFLLGKIPKDYFSQKYVKKPKEKTLMAAIKTFFLSVLGVVLVLLGIIMLVTPGQGVVSIVLGLFLLEFPGKRSLELKMISHDTTFKALNWLRNKANKPPFER